MSNLSNTEQTVVLGVGDTWEEKKIYVYLLRYLKICFTNSTFYTMLLTFPLFIKYIYYTKQLIFPENGWTGHLLEIIQK